VNEIRQKEVAEAAKAAAAGKFAKIRERRRFLLIVFAGFVLAGLGVLA